MKTKRSTGYIDASYLDDHDGLVDDMYKIEAHRIQKVITDNNLAQVSRKKSHSTRYSETVSVHHHLTVSEITTIMKKIGYVRQGGVAGWHDFEDEYCTRSRTKNIVGGYFAAVFTVDVEYEGACSILISWVDC